MKTELQQVRDALTDCKVELWDDWSSGMSEGDFENHWLIMDIDKAAKTIDRLIAEHGWQPIETAPNDGSRILTGKYRSVYWKTNIAKFVNGKFITENNPYWKPTHWMPLPQPPTMQGE